MESGPLTILVRESLLFMIDASVGTTLFRTLYAHTDAGKTDILEGGEVSCAYFVSTLLHHFKLIVSPHATVAGLVRDLETYGWEQVSEPEPGDVIIWESIKQADDQLHSHCGFYKGGNQAVSNDYKTGVPVKHHVTDELPGRAIRSIYRHPGIR